MWSRLIIVLSVVLPCILATTELLSTPGKVFFWSYEGKQQQRQQTAPQYITKSMDITQALNHLHEVGKNYELVVVLHPENTQTDISFITKEVTTNGNNVQVLNYVYPSEQKTEIAPSLQNFFERSQRMTPEALQTTLTEQSSHNLLNNQLPDYVQMVGSGDAMNHLFQNAISSTLSDEVKAKILFVSYEEVAPSTIPVVSSGRRLLGQYSRVLSTVTVSSPLTDGIYYNPEGCEYSIYYANTYLYITPDIFTGIMTGLFVFFTVLIGMTCLGSIQGMSSFYDKIPVVGREA